MKAKAQVNSFFRSALQGVAICLLFAASHGWAQTTANTLIENTATATFTINGTPGSESDSVSFRVEEIIDVTISSTDLTNVVVSTPDSNQVLTFDVQNTGNGDETFSFSIANVASPADDFDIDLVNDANVFIEDGTTPGFQPLEDIQLTGGNDPTLAPGATQVVFIVANIPGGLNDADESQLTLTVESATAGAAGSAPGTELPGLGEGGVSAIVGSTQGDASDNGTFQVANVQVTIDKQILLVTDDFGGDSFLPNSVVTYRIAVSVTGGTAENLVIVDNIPANTTYVAGTLELDDVGLTDIGDADSGDFDVTNPGAITVNLGDQAGPVSFNIDLSVIID